ncbi:hypothetical protein D6774_02290 [Candidatus Woesearchaeota archaeon]|nr:MAG: hypothetical protein D6774_02290 [Candidatus Woesearchaeota archaeon]
MIRKIIFFTLFVTLLISVSALGVAPSKKIIDYAPGKVVRGELVLINNQHESFTAHVAVQGILAQYLNFSLTDFEVSSDQERILIPYTLILPLSQLPGGEHVTEIVIFQEKESSQAMAAQFAVISSWTLLVPLEGIAIEADFYAGKANPGETIEFSIPVKNTGLEDLENVHATIEIELDGRTVGSAQTDFINLPSSDHKKLTAYWKTPLRKNRYTAKATIHYADLTEVLEREFVVGTPAIGLSQLILESFEIGEAAHARAVLYNDWFEPVNNVRLEATISQGNQPLVFAQSPQTSIEAYREQQVDLFFPTQKLTKGKYTLAIDIISPFDRTTQKRSLELSETGAKLESIEPITAKAAAASKQFNKDSLLILVVLILIAFNIYWVVKKRD